MKERARIDPAQVMGGAAIGRTLTITKATGVRFDNDKQELVNETWYIARKRDRKSCEHYLRTHLADKSIIVTESEQLTDYYSLPFDEFIAAAMNRKDEQGV